MTAFEPEPRRIGPYALTDSPWTLTRVEGGRMSTWFRVIHGVGVVVVGAAWPMSQVEPLLSLFLMMFGWIAMVVGGLQVASLRGMACFMLDAPRHVAIERAGSGLPEDVLVVDRRRWPVSAVRDVVVREIVVLGDEVSQPPTAAYLLLPGFVVQLHGARDSEPVVAVATAVRRELGLQPEQPAPARRQLQMLGGGCAIVLILLAEVAVLLAVTMALVEGSLGWWLAGAAVLGLVAIDRLAQEGVRWVTSRNAGGYLARELPAAFDDVVPAPPPRAMLTAIVLLAVLATIVEVLVIVVALVG